MMKSNFPKTVGLICLSLTLAYASVAWAFADCLFDGESHSTEQLASDGARVGGGINQLEAFGEESSADLHCFSAFQSFDVIAPVSAQDLLRQFSKALTAHVALADGSVVHARVRLLMGRSPPNRVAPWPSSGQRARHLLLSVLLV